MDFTDDDGSSGGKNSWEMFHGNSVRTGASKSSFAAKPHLLWMAQVGPVISSPIYRNNIAYVCTMTGRVFALDTRNRKVAWHTNIGSPIVSSPALYNNDLLICATFDSWIEGAKFRGENRIFALDIQNGDVVWAFTATGDVFSSACIIKDMAVAGSMDGNIYALDIGGNLKWKFETLGQVWSSPSSDGDSIFVGSDDGHVYSISLDGTVKWKTRLNGKIRSSSPCVSKEDAAVYIGTHAGGMYCIDAISGKIRWTKCVQQPVLSSPSVFKDRVFFGSSDGHLYCMDALSGLSLWRFKTDGKIWASPAVSADGAVFCCSLDSHIYSVDSGSGSQTWKFPTMAPIDSSPLMADGLLCVGSRDGIAYIFGSYANVPQT